MDEKIRVDLQDCAGQINKIVKFKFIHPCTVLAAPDCHGRKR